MFLSHISGFWAKRILVMAAVIACAILFLNYVPENGQSSAVDANGKSNQSISESVSKFYEEFRMTSRDPIKERYGDFVIVLEDKQQTLSEKISSITKKNYPPTENWQGEFKARAFSKGSTLMTEAQTYVGKEGFTLVWDLGQDFIIRDRFTSRQTLVGMLEEIAGAVDANFDKPINVYFCFKKRALVLTDKATKYLSTNCERSSASLNQYY